MTSKKSRFFDLKWKIYMENGKIPKFSQRILKEHPKK